MGFCFGPSCGAAARLGAPGSSQHTLLHFVRGCLHPACQLWWFCSKLRNVQYFPLSPSCYTRQAKNPTNQPSDTIFQFYCPEFRLGTYTETMQSSWDSNSTITRQKPSLVLIICSPDPGSWSFKDKTQTAHDSAAQVSASCPVQKPAFVSTLCFGCSSPSMNHKGKT